MTILAWLKSVWERPRLPRTVGCYRCGCEVKRIASLHEQCAACGRTVGVCLACTRKLPVFPWRDFLHESMAMHWARYHDSEELAPRLH